MIIMCSATDIDKDLNIPIVYILKLIINIYCLINGTISRYNLYKLHGKLKINL